MTRIVSQNSIRPGLAAWCRAAGRWSCVILLLLSTTAVSALADEDSPGFVEGSAEVGFDGFWHVGRWTRARIGVSGAADGMSISLTAPDPDGNEVLYPASLQPHETEVHAVAEFQAGLLDPVLTWRLLDAEGNLVDRATLRPGDGGIAAPSRLSERGWLAIGENLDFEPAVELLNGGAETPLVALKLLPSLDEVDLAEMSLSPLDVIFHDGLPEVTAAESESLRQWVLRGGRFVLAIGADAERFADSPLSDWVPVEIAGGSSLLDLSGLRSAVPRAPGIRRVRREVPAARLTIDDGIIMAAEIDGPILVRVPHGFGSVTVLGLNWNAPPLVTWEGRSQAIHVLTSDTRAEAGEEIPVIRTLARSGISDVETQIAAAVEQFPSIERAGLWNVLLWAAAFAVIVSLVDYVLVHRVLRRPHLTWFTLPLWIAGAVLISSQVSTEENGSVMLQRQVDVVDVDVSSGLIRSRSWGAIYSPRTRRYEVEVAGRVAERSSMAEGTAALPLRLAWAGVPEERFGGMYRGRGIGMTSNQYRMAEDLAGILNLPITHWSAALLQSARLESLGSEATVVASELTLEGGRPTGTLEHSLPGTLTDWFIAYEARLYRPRSAAGRDLEPGERFEIGTATTRPEMLRDTLTGLIQVTQGQVEGNRPRLVAGRADYNPTSTDLVEIFRTLTFHDRIGGRRYTRLATDGVRELDLSYLASLNRAILFGRLSQPVFQYEVDDEPVERRETSTFVRFVLPVGTQ